MDAKTYTFGTLDNGVALTADVHFAHQTETETQSASQSPKPIVLVLYGGGFVAGAKSAISKARLESLVLDFGFVAVVPNYRHCPTVSVYDGPIQDVRTCFGWAQKTLPGHLRSDLGIDADGNKIAVIGASAGGTLALHLASAAPPPKAIVAYFPAIYLQDEFWSTPMKAMASIPKFPAAFLDKVLEEGTVLETTSSFKQIPESPTPVPDFSRPRVAWLLSHLRDGTWLRDVVQDGDYKRVDPVELFSKSFPPTCFLHGTEDAMCPPRLSEQAHKALRSFQVPSELLVVEGKGHDFENRIDKADPAFSKIEESHRFAAQWV